jgi:hypothetical protein
MGVGAVGSDGDKKYAKGGSDDEKTINGERQRHRPRMAVASHIVLPVSGSRASAV